MTEEHYRNGLKTSLAVPVIKMILSSSLWMQKHPLQLHFSFKPSGISRHAKPFIRIQSLRLRHVKTTWCFQHFRVVTAGQKGSLESLVLLSLL